MSWLFHFLLFGAVTRWKSTTSERERDLLLEIMTLRHQLSVLQRKQPRPRLSPGDRWLWAWISRRWQGWKRACILVKPETVIGWHRQGFRLFWRWKSRRKPGGKRTRADVVALIRRMSRENPTYVKFVVMWNWKDSLLPRFEVRRVTAARAAGYFT